MRSCLRALLVLALALAGAAQLSCKVNDYCLNCERPGDGGPGDAILDAPGDSGGSGDAGCLPTGPEVCDGVDNDCNGLVDDGILPGVGDPCDNQMGECAGGVKQCMGGMLTCSKNPSPEICDGLDNDCNGLKDEGDPGGGGKCGTDQGECVAGTTHCIGGVPQCQGFVDHTMDMELCDGKDNDCDGSFDEGLSNLGTCGNVGSPTPACPSPPCGECKLGTLTCQGGQPVCNGAIGPTFEVCDGKDNDCDGIPDNGFDLMNDPQNCGTCGHVCNLDHAIAKCTAGTCAIDSCKAGYHDNDGDDATGCESGPCFASGPEVCDGVDNDCDGMTDEDLGSPPAICATDGECAGTTATCDGADGWRCHYGATVSTDDPDHTNIVPETLCDGKDNDCNGTPDDHQPNLNQACDDGKQGVCRGTGTYQCDAGDLNGPAVCVITSAGQAPSPESCNNQDDDCDGLIDNGAGQTQNYKNAGDLAGQDWVAIGGGHQMMKYEASKPDASGTTAGNVTATVCSQPGAIPWVNVTYPQALAACQAIGATLCTEQQWHRACAVVDPTTYPLAVPDTSDVKVEAEDYFAIVPGTDHAWVSDYTPGFSGISDLFASSNEGTNNSAATAVTSSPQLAYQLNVAAAAAGNWRVCVYGFSPGNNDDTVWVGIAPTTPDSAGNLKSVTTAANGAWAWMGPSNRISVSAGVNYLTLYMEEDGLRIDQIVLTRSGSCPASPLANPAGNTWAYASSPDTYQAMTCNGQDYDPATDATLPTGSLGQCYADDSTLTGGTAADQAFDMSGNVKEWTMAHLPGENPIRGGASNNTGVGIDCPLNFTLADDTFFFPNVGFRCCR